MKKLQNNKKGFTIIEVLIVLAIGGLILLVVFLAVPALQRNSRNTQRKSDISAIAGAINEYNSNNGGILVDSAAKAATALTAVKDNSKLGFYDPAKVFANTTGTPPPATAVTGAAASATVVNSDSAIIWFGYDCANGAAGLPAAASKRSVAIQSVVETGTTGAIGQIQCTQG